MSDAQTFGAFFKELRIRQRKTLRQFCEENDFDPGNTSKLERDRLQAPQSPEVLERYAHALGLQKGSDGWHKFLDLAALSAGRIPADLQDDAEIIARLPLVFRTLRGQQPDGDKLDRLIELIRSS